MEESVKNLEQEQPCGEMENAMEQEQQAPIDFLVHCKQALRLEKIDIANYSPLALAYIGDAVYELMIRTHVVSPKISNTVTEKILIKCESFLFIISSK